MDSVDAIMAVMDAAFDPAYGEAWNRRQVEDALSFPNTHFLLADRDGREPDMPQDAAGFAMSRQAADEEELLLLAVMPAARGTGVGHALMRQFITSAHARGARRLFLEMREGNPASALYQAHGFTLVGRRKDYYRSGTGNPLDALTYSRLSD